MFSNIRSLIFKLDPETAHNLAIKSLKFNFVPNILDTNNFLLPLVANFRPECNTWFISTHKLSTLRGSEVLLSPLDSVDVDPWGTDQDPGNWCLKNFVSPAIPAFVYLNSKTYAKIHIFLRQKQAVYLVILKITL